MTVYEYDRMIIHLLLDLKIVEELGEWTDRVRDYDYKLLRPSPFLSGKG